MIKKKIEFSKLIIAGVMITFFIAFFVGIIIIVKGVDNSYTAQTVGYLFTLVGGQSTVAIGVYAMKAKAENVEKIRNSNTQANEEFADDSQIRRDV